MSGPYMDDVLRDIRDTLVDLKESGGDDEFMRGYNERQRIRDAQFAALGDGRRGSRYVGAGADQSLAAHIAAGGTVETAKRVNEWGTKSYSGSASLAEDDKGGRTLIAGLKALAAGTGSSGGYLTFPQLANELTPLLRARTGVIALGARVFPVEVELDVAGLSTGAAAFWSAENSHVPTSEPTFNRDVVLRPKRLASLIPVSNRLLRTGHVSPALDTVLREDLAEVIALRADAAFMRGTGTGGEPLGLANTAGLTPAPDLGANGRAVTYDDLMDVVAAHRAINSPFSKVGWLFNSRLLSSLEKLKAADGRYLKDASLLTYDKTGAGGTLLGYPFRTTSQIPTNITRGTSTDTTQVFFSSAWDEYWIGQSDDVAIALSSEASYTPDGGTTWISAFQASQTLFRAEVWLDGAPRRPQLFSVLQGVRP